MNPEEILAGTASLFLALGDKTRLRLLNLMRDREVCVSSFTGVLGQSQPLVSRHLAYLRNSGIVEARRDGKWIHYSVSSQLDDNTSRLLFELFRWMETQEGLQLDRDRYAQVSGEGASPVSKPATTSREHRAARAAAQVPIIASETDEVEADEPEYELPEAWEPEVELEVKQDYEPEPEFENYEPVRHNELEDFLL